MQDIRTELWTGYNNEILHIEHPKKMKYAKCDSKKRLTRVECTVDIHMLESKIDLCIHCFEFYTSITEWK